MMKTKNNLAITQAKDRAYYLSLPYSVEITPIPDGEGGGYAACVPLLGRWSAVGDGTSPEAAYADLRMALTSLLDDWIRRGIAIPEPDAEIFASSGRLSLRLPKTLHRQTAEVA
jgi:predicted RNase H-like HicB family nuclease